MISHRTKAWFVQGSRAGGEGNLQALLEGVQRGTKALLVDGVEGSAKAPPSWGAGESEVSLASGAAAIRLPMTRE